MAVRGLISHPDLNVADPEVSIEFYALVLGHLGFERRDIDAGRACWSLTYADGATFAIEIRPPAGIGASDRHDRYSPGIDHLAFHASSRADVDEIHRILLGTGREVATPPAEYDYTPGYYAVAFDDPSGIRLEVVYEPSSNPSPLTTRR